MKTHYYLGWFTDVFPQKLTKVLQEDIDDRRSLVMISGNPRFKEDDYVGAIEQSWLMQANIHFDEHHLIDYSIQKEIAQTMISNASVIFLLGGDTVQQNDFLMAYDLSKVIKYSKAVVLGTSAGAINMSVKWVSLEEKNNPEYTGIGFDDFSVLSHYDLENNWEYIVRELSPLSEEMKVYASNKNCAIRVKGNNMDILGDIYLISHSKIHKVDETL